MFTESEREYLGTVEILSGEHYVIDVLHKIDHAAWTERLNDWIDGNEFVELASDPDMPDSEIWYAYQSEIEDAEENGGSGGMWEAEEYDRYQDEWGTMDGGDTMRQYDRYNDEW
jgi:hypothetical protein